VRPIDPQGLPLVLDLEFFGLRDLVDVGLYLPERFGSRLRLRVFYNVLRERYVKIFVERFASLFLGQRLFGYRLGVVLRRNLLLVEVRYVVNGFFEYLVFLPCILLLRLVQTVVGIGMENRRFPREYSRV